MTVLSMISIHIILGRRDTQIKVRGQRVNLSEVENAILTRILLYDSAKIVDCKVLVIGQNTYFQKIVAFFTTSDDEDPLGCQIKIENQLNKILPPYMIPKLFHCPLLPTLVNGKVDRQSLIKSYEESLVFEASYTDDELKEDGCTSDESKYEKARMILNAVCSVIGTLFIKNDININSSIKINNDFAML